MASIRGWAEKIEAAQRQKTETLGGKAYQRVPYGADFPDSRGTCRDCAVSHGMLHVRGCCVERCARCRGQAYGCNCYEIKAH